MSFASIVGHKRPVTILKRAWENDTLAHAYLFSGDEGIGKRMTALALAATVNCRQPGPDGGCGLCQACRMTASQSHPDLQVVEPDGDEIKIDQIREVQSTLSLKPHEGRKKILIVDQAEAMNVASANAFLKTLEEPPGNSLIILISSMPQRLLRTIRSRCQEVKFLPLPAALLADVLVRAQGKSDADSLAALACGSIGRAFTMNIEEERADRDDVLALFSRAKTMSAGEALVESEALAKDRERLEKVLTIGTEWLRDVMVYQVTGNERLLVHRYAAEKVRHWSERFSIGSMVSMLELIQKSRNLLDARVSAQLVLENLLLRLGNN